MTGRHFISGFLFIIIVAGGALAVLWTATRPPLVQTASVKRGQAVEAIYATAVVEPVTWAAVAPVATGRITEIDAHEGDIVHKGDVLAKLDSAPLQASLEEAQAQQVYQQKELERATKLSEKGHVSQEKFDAAQSALDQTQARIKMIEEQIAQLSLTAPADGTILWRDAEPGEVKPAGTTIFWVGQPRPLRLKADVDEQDIPRIKTGQTVLITADAFPGEVMEGRIQRISPKGDPVNKSYRVYVSLPDDTRLMIGMTVETNTIAQKKDNVLLAPAEAMVPGSAVWRVTKGAGAFSAVHKTPVDTGIAGADQVEITGGLTDGDTVALPPFDKLKDGGKVRVK